MALVNIEGIEVVFPFEPYYCQKNYMTQVIKALNLKCDAALESPTGTGKTLSLLCSILAWFEREKLNFVPTLQNSMSIANRSIIHTSKLMPKIYYCSRTHSQLAQVIRELNKTVYKTIKTTVLGSRDQLCVHEKVSKEQNNNIKTMMCRSMVTKHTCNYYNKWNTCDSTNLKSIYESSGNVLDIEDLTNLAKKHSHCPYFQSRSLKETAELILLPYNYIISPELRRIHEIDLKGSIVVFDEAHNLESICENCTSTELSTTDVAMCIKELQKAIEIMQEETELIRTQLDNGSECFGKSKDKKEEPAFEIGTAAALLKMLFDLEKAIEEFYKTNTKHRTYRHIEGKVFKGSLLLELLGSVQFNFDKAGEIMTILRKAAEFLHDKAEAGGHKLQDTNGYLTKLETFLSVVFMSHPIYEGKTNPLATQLSYDQRKPEKTALNYRLYMHKERDDNGEKTDTIIIKFWCFSAELAMKSLKERGVRSVIVTSGTLSPLAAFTKTIGLDFGCTLENEHAANNDQVYCGIISKAKTTGNKMLDLNGKFDNRNDNYFTAIANCLQELAGKVPQGILVFFASYGLMNSTVNIMKARRKNQLSVWEEISITKKIVVEPKTKRDLAACRLEFTEAVRTKNGAMFLAVCRGKVSEGIDFADADSRAVVIVGLPFPALMDERVMLKRYYLTEKSKDNKETLNGDAWYNTEAYRAVNQALGRVLRHVNDFGIVALLDSRFNIGDRSKFPSWLRPSIRNFEDMDAFMAATDRFFNERGAEIKESERRLKTIYTETARVSRKRAIENIENYQLDYSEDDYNEEVFTENIIESVDSLSALGEKQDASAPKRPQKVVINSGFGKVETALSQQPPQRKKIKLVPRTFSKDNIEDKATPSINLSNEQPVISKNSSPEETIKNVSKLKAIRDLNPDEIKVKLKELGGVYKELNGVFKALQKNPEQFQMAYKRMKELLLPNNPQALVMISKFFTTDQQLLVDKDCLPFI